MLAAVKLHQFYQLVTSPKFIITYLGIISDWIIIHTWRPNASFLVQAVMLRCSCLQSLGMCSLAMTSQIFMSPHWKCTAPTPSFNL